MQRFSHDGQTQLGIRVVQCPALGAVRGAAPAQDVEEAQGLASTEEGGPARIGKGGDLRRRSVSTSSGPKRQGEDDLFSTW